MNDFMNAMAGVLTDSADNKQRTENGALGYKSTGRKLVDLNFAVSSMRKFSAEAIEQKFAAALGEDFNATVTWLFFARDIRGCGLGERRLFRICMNYLSREFPGTTHSLLHLIPLYGRWDDLVSLYSTTRSKLIKDAAVKLIEKQLKEDMTNYKAGASISLLAKWMPSINTSSKNTVRTAVKLAEDLHLNRRDYQRMLSKLRAYLRVVECDMSAGKWDSINYEAVPSRANLSYNSAFLRHDEERRRKFLGKLEKGEAKINSSVLFPHDIVYKYSNCRGWGHTRPGFVQSDLEAMWKGLPNYVTDGQSTLVVADGSGSMCTNVDPHSGVTAMIVADALAVYFAEKLTGPYKNKYITFSSRPQIVDLGGASTLCGKLNIVAKNNDCTNTNIQKVFDLILATAIRNNASQDELPGNVLVISDMEFDYGCIGRPDKTLFENIAMKYAAHGYKLPRLVFWNVASRTGTIPVKENEAGVALVSGFSPAVTKMVMSNKTDPLDALMETLNGVRYAPVREALLSK